MTQAQAEAACTKICAASNTTGVVTPKLTAKGTPECDAFCAKADALGCPGATCAEKEDFWCQVDANSCLAAKRAYLQCVADKGVFSCDANSWTQSASGCSNFKELCP